MNLSEKVSRRFWLRVVHGGIRRNEFTVNDTNVTSLSVAYLAALFNPNSKWCSRLLKNDN